MRNDLVPAREAVSEKGCFPRASVRNLRPPSASDTVPRVPGFRYYLPCARTLPTDPRVVRETRRKFLNVWKAGSSQHEKGFLVVALDREPSHPAKAVTQSSPRSFRQIFTRARGNPEWSFLSTYTRESAAGFLKGSRTRARSGPKRIVFRASGREISPPSPKRKTRRR
jgi:hypothetical protein